MLDQSIGICERLLTNFAHLVTYIEMRLDVILEIAIRKEILGAHVALVCPNFRMHRRHMVAHLDFLLKGFATELAYKRFGHMCLVMGAEMCTQLAGEGEATLTNVTAEGFAHMNTLDVLLQMTTSLEMTLTEHALKPTAFSLLVGTELMGLQRMIRAETLLADVTWNS